MIYPTALSIYCKHSLERICSLLSWYWHTDAGWIHCVIVHYGTPSRLLMDASSRKGPAEWMRPGRMLAHVYYVVGCHGPKWLSVSGGVLDAFC